ncbi:nitroreductase family deazaflavin-dependent oxidoreductase [Streptomyces sp. NPDC056987]|uniref:nitroreductase family deazaflavin-dependent oxidoreductase n=1 Tax=Streptomyces sp. NPDC056987 TaxID=3345988 RepID=UPI00362F010F
MKQPSPPPGVTPPTGWRRKVDRLPILLYRAGLGPLFGRRMLLLIHTGRFTGQSRQVVIGVVEQERAPRSWTVTSGSGASAQWYRNLRHTPQVTIQTGRRYHAVTARFPAPEECGLIMERYARARPRAARTLCAFLGLDPEADAGPDADADARLAAYRAAGERIAFVRLEESRPSFPRPASSPATEPPAS